MSTFHALLIGIDYYQPHQLPNGDFYPCLSGCVGDIALVEEFLRQELSIPLERISKLTSSLRTSGADKPPEPRTQWPTYENIVKAFSRVTNEAAPGDQVYIHYSGHGGRVPTKFPAIKETDGLDETLVPMDIGDPNSQHLRDLELAHLLKEMVEKELIVTVTLDCCHSGGATRSLGKGTARVRGINSIDHTPRPAASLVASDDELIATWRGVTARATRNARLGDDWFWKPQGYVLLAACRPSEFAYEDIFNGGESHGALTYGLIRAIKQLGFGLNYQQIYQQLWNEIHGRFPTQTPMIVGDGDRMVFGVERLNPIYTVLVLQANTESQRIQLHAGEAQGIRRGAQFAIYPPGKSDFGRSDERLALVEVDNVGATISEGRITEPPNSGAIERGYQAVLTNPAMRRNVQPVSMKGTDRELTALRRLEEALSSEANWLRLCGAGQQAHYQVAVNEQHEYEVRHATGTALAHLWPAIKAGTAEAASALVQRLVHLSRYHFVEELACKNQISAAGGGLIVELRSLRDGSDSSGNSMHGQPVPKCDSFSPGEKFELHIRNTSSQVLNITALDLQSDWGITQIIPYTEGAFFEPLDAGSECNIQLETSLPPNVNEGTDIIKVFATKEPANFRWLELPPLNGPVTRTIKHNEKAADAFKQLLISLSTSKQSTRQIKVAAYREPEWITAQVVLQIKNRRIIECADNRVAVPLKSSG